ncbi:hypothetical protein BDZ89DRAFT_337938 [Hymenopellis radicata]|nr:hypothetical protein BDZ89DRAFT_337938 [Hymenopellis radicata]
MMNTYSPFIPGTRHDSSYGAGGRWCLFQVYFSHRLHRQHQPPPYQYGRFCQEPRSCDYPFDHQRRLPGRVCPL